MRTGANWADAPDNVISRITKGKRQACKDVEDFIGSLECEASDD
jgi:hypothetical protein